MALASTTSTVSLAGLSTTGTSGSYPTGFPYGPYPVPFIFFNGSTDLTVVLSSSGAVQVSPLTNNSTLVYGTDFETSGGGFNSTGNVWFAYPTSLTVTITRQVSTTQPTSFSAGSSFPASSIEQAYDWLCMQTQQLNRILNGFPTVQPSSGNFVLSLLNGALSWASPSTASIGANAVTQGNMTTSGASPWVLNGGITGNLTGNVTGNVTGNISGGTVNGTLTGTALSQVQQIAAAQALIFG